MNEIAPATLAAPYVGLEPYRFAHQSIFFARDSESLELLHLLVIYRGVLLYGESGVGKSSLLNAGLVPAAIERGFTPERLRVQPRRGQEIVLERIPAGPGPGEPFLRSSLVRGYEEASASRLVLAVDSFMERVRGAPLDHPPLLIFDRSRSS